VTNGRRIARATTASEACINYFFPMVLIVILALRNEVKAQRAGSITSPFSLPAADNARCRRKAVIPRNNFAVVSLASLNAPA
jgi:hypothetical protein